MVSDRKPTFVMSKYYLSKEEIKMSLYEEGLKLIEEKFGNGKDNAISLATITRESNSDGKPRPVVRSVNAYYEDSTFYIVTYGKSNKIQRFQLQVV